MRYTTRNSDPSNAIPRGLPPQQLAARGELLHAGGQHVAGRRHAGAEELPAHVVLGRVPHQHVVLAVERDGGRPGVPGGERQGDPAGIEDLPVGGDAGRVHGGRGRRRRVMPGDEEVLPVEGDRRLSVRTGIRMGTADQEVLTDVEARTCRAGRACVSKRRTQGDRSQRQRRQTAEARQAESDGRPREALHRTSPP